MADAEGEETTSRRLPPIRTQLVNGLRTYWTLPHWNRWALRWAPSQPLQGTAGRERGRRRQGRGDGSSSEVGRSRTARAAYQSIGPSGLQAEPCPRSCGDLPGTQSEIRGNYDGSARGGNFEHFDQHGFLDESAKCGNSDHIEEHYIDNDKSANGGNSEHHFKQDYIDKDARSGRWDD